MNEIDENKLKGARYDYVHPSSIGMGSAKDVTDVIGSDLMTQDGRFLFHDLCGVLIPSILAAYYVWIYVTYLGHWGSPNEHLANSTPNATYVWWSWFIVGAVGLNISNYSLAGFEAGMLASSTFQLQGVEQTMSHGDKSWSLLSGWRIALASIGRRISGRGQKGSEPGPLWFILFGLSVLSWSFVLSGLTMEVGEGYAAGDKAGTDVFGANASTMSNRLFEDIAGEATKMWQYGLEPQLPLAGALYTSSGNRLQADISKSAIFPSVASPDLFLAPQAETPIIGEAWGLAFKYNCSVVQSMHEFTILNRPNDLQPPSPDDFRMPAHVFGDAEAYLLAQGPSNDSSASNLEGIVQLGSQTGNGSSYLGGSPELHRADIFEVMLWQSLVPKPESSTFGGFNSTIVDAPQNYTDSTGAPMAVIGARCLSSASTGLAIINGLTGTFSNFKREDDALQPSADMNFFGMSGLSYVVQGDDTLTSIDGGNPDWMWPIFSSVGITRLVDQDGNITYFELAQASHLQRSLADSYKHTPIQFMYDNNRDPKRQWFHPNLTAAVTRSTLKKPKSGIPPLFIVITILAWAGGCVILGIAFGFRRRWSKTLDARSMFWLGQNTKGQAPDRPITIQDFRRVPSRPVEKTVG